MSSAVILRITRARGFSSSFYLSFFSLKEHSRAARKLQFRLANTGYCVGLIISSNVISVDARLASRGVASACLSSLLSGKSHGVRTHVINAVNIRLRVHLREAHAP